MATKKKAVPMTVNELGYRVLSGTPPAKVAEKRLTRASMFAELRDLCFGGSSGVAFTRRERVGKLIDALAGDDDA